MIITAFAISLQKQPEAWWTCAQVAKKIGMVRSSALDTILLAMVDDGRLQQRIAQRPGRWTSREYMLAEGTYTLPKKRAIALKMNGKQKGQLELW